MDFDYVVAPILILLTALCLSWFCVRRLLSGLDRYRKWRRMTERVVLSLITLVAITVACSTAFNALAIHHFRAAYRPPGQIYEVGGYRMHIYCTGNGSPTLILDAGFGGDFLVWSKVQPELSKTTRVCSYDRAGYGWSDPRPGPRDASEIAYELHQLLLQAGITEPVVLMGHSIAGLYIRAYASHYPQSVSGLVFVDASIPLQDERPAFKPGLPVPGEIALLKLAVLAGLLRPMSHCSGPEPGFDPEIGRIVAQNQCAVRVAVAGEIENFHQSGEETIHAGPFGALPVLILSEDTSHRESPKPASQSEKEFALEWDAVQEDLKGLSTRSRRIIAKNSSHFVQIDRADLINREVPIFIEQIRGNVAQPADYGSTTTE